MTVKQDIEKFELHIQDKGVTIRTLLAVAAKGHQITGRRRWQLIYNGVNIGSLQVANYRVAH